MFDIGWSELLLIGVVALIAIGPKELPGALRTLGQWMAKVRRMAAEFQGQFHEAMREAELDQLKKDMDDMAAKAKEYTHFDPVAEMGRDIEKSIGDMPPLDQPAGSAATPNPSPVAADTTSPSAVSVPAESTVSAETMVTTASPPEPLPASTSASTSSAPTTDATPAAGRAPA